MAAQDLTTLVKVKQNLGIKDTDVGGDATLSWLITALSTWMLRALGRNLLQAPYTDLINGDNTFSVTLAEQPVVSVVDPNGVYIDGGAIPKRPTVLDTGWVLVNGRVHLVGYTFTRGVANVTISYTAGYATIPEDIEQAVVHFVGEVYRLPPRYGLASRGSSASGDVTSFKPADVPVYVQWVIDTYRRVAGVAP